MARGLSLFAIGLVFGGGIGFLIAASNGVTLDGHDHSDPAAHGARAHDAHGDHAMAHDTQLVLPEGADAPKLAVEILPDPMSGWNVRIAVENFRFAPENASLENRPGEGHAHIYVNGSKLARVYGPWFHIASLPAGADAVIDVALYSNDHSALVVGDQSVKASVAIAVP